jgi:hypothetical protein
MLQTETMKSGNNLWQFHCNEIDRVQQYITIIQGQKGTKIHYPGTAVQT